MNRNLKVLLSCKVQQTIYLRYNSHSSLKIYNTLSKKLEPLELQNSSSLTWYSCGPTVYDSAHLGHASSYVYMDIIQRILRGYFDLNVVNVMNITDVDDKIITRAQQEKKSISEVSQFYEKEFLEDLNLLNCVRPSVILRVTEHIPEIITFISKLIDTGRAYSTSSGSVYFRTKSFKVKSFFNPPLTDEKSDNEKEHPHDFSLWKARKTSDEPSWESPWGQGRPGWHIECSTLANIAFGKNLDFHSGGKDLVFPHHHNELTQCCAYHDSSSWASHWLHTGHLHLSGQLKMSKSLKNTVSIRDALEKYTSNQLRVFCLLSPYRNDIEFSTEKMETSVSLLRSIQTFLQRCHSYCNDHMPEGRIYMNEIEVYERLADAQRHIHASLSDDLNTREVIDELIRLVNHMNKHFQAAAGQKNNKNNDVSSQIKNENDLNRHYGCVMSVANYVGSTLALFGLELDQQKQIANNGKTNELIGSSLKFRKSIRNFALNKNQDIPKDVRKFLLETCDEFRTDFHQNGVEFKDIKGETIWQLKD